MKPSYREHYFNLAAEQNRTKILAAEQNCTKILASEQNHTKAADVNSAREKSSSEESYDIGSEDCGVNVFEDGTILEDRHDGDADSDAADQPLPLVEALTSEEEGGQEENDEEDENMGGGRTDILEGGEKTDKEEDLVERAMLTKEEGEDVNKEEDLEEDAMDPLDMEVSDETGNLYSEEGTNLMSNLAETDVEKDETCVERDESAEEASARELTEATMFIADPDRGEAERGD